MKISSVKYNQILLYFNFSILLVLHNNKKAFNIIFYFAIITYILYFFIVRPLKSIF